MPTATIMRTCLGALAALVAFTFSGSLWAADPVKPKGTQAPAGRFSFSLLPKSFQKNPRLNFNVMTEMTAEGRKRALPTAEAPNYYIMQVMSAEARGFTPPDLSKDAMKPEQVEQLVAQALRPNHYLAAPEEGPRPSLVLIVHWGAYSNPAFNGEEGLSETLAQSSTAQELLPLVLGSVPKRKAIIERASLIGGAAFAQQLNEVLNAEVALRRDADSSDSARAVAGQSDGSSLLSLLDAVSPLALFMKKDRRTEAMVEEVFSDSYYVVVSAMDYLSVAQRKPILLWRTKLTLNSVGLSFAETVPSLIGAGTDYFGRETEKAVAITKRLNREGKVEVGEAKVLDYGPSVDASKEKSALPKDGPLPAKP